ncbi:MAG TPA: rhomboid family intramembrane serine protease [Bacteroidales bacterium]|nr:rhomboid family intramembrane serine protease [Bacteroidales bacterium]
MTKEGSDLKKEGAFYRKKLLLNMIIPGIFVLLMWLVKLVEILFETDFSRFGIYPLTAKGLPGILFSPFIHANFTHLFSNTVPLFFLSLALFYFYSEVALKVFIWTYFLTGILVWVGGREAWHIGASGVVYGLASFLFFSGIIRRYFRLIALSLLIVFLYGSMVWGLFPGVYKNVSWESHMLGFFSGALLAVLYRNQGPQKPVYEWLEEESDDNEDDYKMNENEEKTEGENGGQGEWEKEGK